MFTPLKELQAKLETAETGINVTASAVVLDKPGDKFRGYFVGFSHFEKTDAKTGEIISVKVANFLVAGAMKFNMGAQLTREMEKITTGSAVEVELTELKKNAKGGATKIYNVRLLNVEPVNVPQIFGQLQSANEPAQIEAPKSQEEIKAAAEKANSQIFE